VVLGRVLEQILTPQGVVCDRPLGVGRHGSHGWELAELAQQGRRKDSSGRIRGGFPKVDWETLGATEVIAPWFYLSLLGRVSNEARELSQQWQLG
jgi:hypothetical protein